MFYHNLSHINFQYSQNSLNIINNNPPTTGADWEKECYDPVQSEIKTFLSEAQRNICPFCGLPMDTRHGSQMHIEHFAHKGRYASAMFEIKNLTISCAGCNMKKHVYNTVSNNQGNYATWTFCAVHPYFDNPILHLEYSNFGYITSLSEKGTNTIKMFDLASDYLTLERTKAILYQKCMFQGLAEIILNFECSETT